MCYNLKKEVRMKKLFSHPLFHLALVLFVVLGFEGYSSVSAQYVAPNVQPPLGVFYPPLDTGSSTQTVGGSLVIGNSSQPLRLQLSPAGIQWVDSNGNVTSSIVYDVNVQGIRVSGGGYSSVLGYNWQSSNGILFSTEPVIVGASNQNSPADLSGGNFMVPDFSILNQDRSGGLNIYTNPLGTQNYSGMGPVILSAGYFSTSSLLAQYNAPSGSLPNGDIVSFSGIFVNHVNGFMDLASDVIDNSSLLGSGGYGNFSSGAFVRVYANGNVDVLRGSMSRPSFANITVGKISENPLMDASSTLNSKVVIWSKDDPNSPYTYGVSVDKNIPAANTTGVDNKTNTPPIICPNGYYIDAIKFESNSLPDIHCTQMFQSF